VQVEREIDAAAEAAESEPASTKAATRTAAAKKTSAKAAEKRAPVKKAPTKKAAAKKAPAKTAPAKKTSAKAAPPKATATKAPAKKTTAATKVADLAVLWTAAELAEVRAELADELARLQAEYAVAMTDLDDLQQRANDGAGDDQADAGTKTFEREQELFLLHNKGELITQSERAIERIDAGTYGRCETCEEPIAKARLQAFPSATLCVSCKQRQERR